MPLLVTADARHLPLADESVDCIVMSPPYWQLRDYGGHPLELGRERLHDCGGWLTGTRCDECYVCHMAEAGQELFRVLRPSGTLWLNIGDTYASGGRGGGGRWADGNESKRQHRRSWVSAAGRGGWRKPPAGLKDKDLALIPQRVALAYQALGWHVRSEVVWAKTNPQPGSYTDRPTTAHEQIWLMTKAKRYWFDHKAIREPAVGRAQRRLADRPLTFRRMQANPGAARVQVRPEPGQDTADGKRAKRTVWPAAVSRYPGSHFATMPPEIVRPCVLAGCPPHGVVLDPFAGAGTVGLVAMELGRRAILSDISGRYLRECAEPRLAQRATRGIQIDLDLPQSPTTLTAEAP